VYNIIISAAVSFLSFTTAKQETSDSVQSTDAAWTVTENYDKRSSELVPVLQLNHPHFCSKWQHPNHIKHLPACFSSKKVESRAAIETSSWRSSSDGSPSRR
jgi:hypothetical protein